MRIKNRLFHRWIPLLTWLSLALLLSACSFDLTGLHAVSPDGRWATVVRGENQALYLMDLEAADGDLTLLAEEAESIFKGTFSEDSRYLLFYNDLEWVLVETGSGSQRPIAGSEEVAEFLPNGEILVTASDGPLGRFSVIRSPVSEEAAEVVAENILFRFSNRPVISRMPGPGFPGVYGCPNTTHTFPAVWVLVDIDNVVSVLSARHNSPSSVSLVPPESAAHLVQYLEPGDTWYLRLVDDIVFLSRTYIREYDESDRLSEELAGVLRELVGSQTGGEVEATIHISPNNEVTIYRESSGGFARIELNPEFASALLSWIEQRGGEGDDFVSNFLSEEIQIIDSSVQQFGLPSPDGSKLLFLRTENVDEIGDQFFLDLLDLSAEGGGPVSLVSGSDEAPYFNFSPDGEQIIFESNVTFGDPMEFGRFLFRAKSDVSEIERIDTSGQLVRACWH